VGNTGFAIGILTVLSGRALGVIVGRFNCSVCSIGAGWSTSTFELSVIQPS